MLRIRAPGLVAFMVIAAGPAIAQDGGREARSAAAARVGDDYLDRTPERCISLPRVRDTEVLDDRTILFYLRGGDVFMNVLDSACFGLKSADRFLSETRTTRLCSSDIIQSIRQFGSRVYPESFCRLGEFYPLSRAEAELLEMEPDELAEARRSVVLTPLESVEVLDEADSNAAPDGSNDSGDGQGATGEEPVTSEESGP